MLLDSLLRFDPSGYDLGAGNFIADSVASSSTIFGSGSAISHEVVVAGGSVVHPLSSWELSSVILLIVVIYCYSAYRYGAMMNGCLKSAFSVNGALALFEFQSIDFNRFIRFGILLGILCVSVVSSALFSGYSVELPLVMGAAVVSMIGMRIWGAVARWIFSLLDHDPLRWRVLGKIADHTFVVIAIAGTLPVILISLLMHASFLIELLLSILCIYYVLKIVFVFKTLRFSFLQSFLYLCAVVAVPLALILGTVVRLKLL